MVVNWPKATVHTLNSQLIKQCNTLEVSIHSTDLELEKEPFLWYQQHKQQPRTIMQKSNQCGDTNDWLRLQMTPNNDTSSKSIEKYQFGLKDRSNNPLPKKYYYYDNYHNYKNIDICD